MRANLTIKASLTAAFGLLALIAAGQSGLSILRSAHLAAEVSRFLATVRAA